MMNEPVDLRTGKPPKQICCYKCASTKQLLIEEKITPKTGRVIEKNFICIKCAKGFKHE
jgi:hypothetical protein